MFFNPISTNTIFYVMSDRSRALQLCGWYCKEQQDTHDPLTLLLDSLVNQNHEYERAAAIALFNLKIGTAVQILSSEAAVQGVCVCECVLICILCFINIFWFRFKSTCRCLFCIYSTIGVKMKFMKKNELILNCL